MRSAEVRRRSDDPFSASHKSAPALFDLKCHGHGLSAAHFDRMRPRRDIHSDDAGNIHHGNCRYLGHDKLFCGQFRAYGEEVTATSPCRTDSSLRPASRRAIETLRLFVEKRGSHPERVCQGCFDQQVPFPLPKRRGKLFSLLRFGASSWIMRK